MQSESQILWLAAYGIALVILLSLTAPRHGPWFDEFWTRFFSDPSVSLLSAFTERWAADVHPPLFSFLAWLTAQIGRLPVEQARLLNLIPLGLLTMYLVLLGKAEPRERPLVTILSISLGSSAFFGDYFIEFRSYFTGLCAFTGLTVTLVMQDRRTHDGDNNTSILLWIGYAVTLIICLNIHYLTSAMTVVMVAVFGLAAAARKNWLRFAIYLVSGILACAPFIAFLAYQRSTIERISKDYWLKTDISSAVDMIASTLASPASQMQSLVAFAWISAAVLLLRGKARARLNPTALILLLAIAAEIALLLAYTWLTAAMTVRYLIPLSILSTALFSLVLSRQIYETRWLLTLFIVTNFLGALAAAVPHWNDPRWDEAAEFLAQRQKACPGARIVPMQQDPNDHTPNTIENYDEAYAYMARKWSLVVGAVDVPSTRSPDQTCSDYYWADHFFAAGKSNETLLRQFNDRWPALQGCRITATAFESMSAVFEVTGEPPACGR